MADVPGRQDTHRIHGEKDAIVEYDGAVPAWIAGTAAAMSVSRTVYSRKAVLAAAYKLSDRCTVLVDADGDERYLGLFIERGVSFHEGSTAQALHRFSGSGEADC